LAELTTTLIIAGLDPLCMSAVDSVMKLLKAGDHVVCSDDVYGGVSRHSTKYW